MIDVDFSKIREYEGSQHNGFEQLVCQIAALEKIDGMNKFVNKHGSGGDGGIECYWKLGNGDEFGWQAKYFLHSLGQSEWRQIDKSVKTALEKHPRLKKYYVCVPKDLTDSRKDINGKRTISEFDKWNEHVEAWSNHARSLDLDVEFIYWGKFELTNRLISLKDLQKGKIEYWFNSNLLTLNSLEHLCELSRMSLGERYSEENNINLPIEAAFRCIGKEDFWIQKMREEISKVDDIRRKITRLSGNKLLSNFTIEVYSIKELLDTIIEVIIHFDGNSNVLFDNYDFILKNTQNLKQIISEFEQVFSTYSFSSDISKNDIRTIENELLSILMSVQAFNKYLETPAFKAGKEKVLLVTGEAGSGKSHLLCDVSIRRLKQKLPTIFLLGQHYNGVNPIQFIGERLGFENVSPLEILSAINSLGETYNSRVLIIIDALNEGTYRNLWSDFIIDFLHQCEKYEFIAIVLSCRDTYLDYILPENVLNKLPLIIHEGFKGTQSAAARKYLENNNIQAPNTPFLSQEFTNPLFLKIVCQSMKNNKIREFPKGILGFNTLFEYYLQSIESIIAKKLNMFNTLPIRQSIINFTEALYPDNLWGIPYMEALSIFDKFDNKKGDMTLMDLFITEGLLSIDYEVSTNKDSFEVVRFVFERFGDYCIANNILKNYKTQAELEKSFLEGCEISNILKNKYANRGIIEALSIEIPTKYGKEFIDYLNFSETDFLAKNWYLETCFLNTILMRDGSSITERSLELLNGLLRNRLRNNSMDVLIRLAIEPTHPWNAEFLNAQLKNKALATRDAFWSTYIAVNDYAEDEEQLESPIRMLLNWALNTKLDGVDQERLRLLSITFLWFTTTSNRLLRSQATKALSKVLFMIKESIPTFITEFSSIDDMYLVSSLYAAIYGAVVKIDDNNLISKITENIPFEIVIEGEHPNILLRDYISGIYEYAIFRGAISKDMKSIHSPYKSKWPLDIPGKDEIDRLGDGFSRIKQSIQGGLNDFGKYTMSDIHNWSCTELATYEKPKSCKEVTKEFIESLDKITKSKYNRYLDLKIKQEKADSLSTSQFFETLLDGEVSTNNINPDEKSALKEQASQMLEELKSSIPENKKESFEWIQTLGISDRPAKFNFEWAQRWVIKRAYELGWSESLFGEFEKNYCSYHTGSTSNRVERIGKKYQWIAFHELLAILSDNLIFIDRGYSDTDDSRYFGAWQLALREFDPTTWVNERTFNTQLNYSLHWWVSDNYKLFPDLDMENQNEWLWDEASIPNLKDCFQYVNSEDQTSWISLSEFQKWDKKLITKKEMFYEPQIWYRVNSLVIKKKDLKKLKSVVSKDNTFESPDIIYIPNNQNQRYLEEYPWHSSYFDLSDWYQNNTYTIFHELNYHIPLFEYSWPNDDEAEETYTTAYCPSNYLIKGMDLKKSINCHSEWLDRNNKLAFFDSSFKSEGTNKAIVNKELLCHWLHRNDFVLVWLIGGEKRLINHRIDKYLGRTLFSGLYYMDGSGEIDGEQWHKKEHP